MTGLSITSTRLLLGAAAGLLFLGSALFAATAPGGARPRVSDLPVISLTRDVNEAASPAADETPIASVDPTATPAVSATSTTAGSTNPATRPSDRPVPSAATPGTSGDDEDREVVSPPVRDDDDDDDDDREVVSPPVRDDDDDDEHHKYDDRDTSRAKDGESSSHEDLRDGD